MARALVKSSQNPRNLIINGNLDYWQRGSSFSPAANTLTYTADRMYHKATVLGTSVVQETTTLPSNNLSRRALRINSDVGALNTIGQRIEGYLSQPLIGKTVHFGMWLYNGHSSDITPTLEVSRANALDDFSAVTLLNTISLQSCPAGQWTHVSAQIELSDADIKNGLQMEIKIPDISSNYVILSQIQLLDAVDTNLKNNYRYFAEDATREIEACQRYYEKSYLLDVAPGTSTDTGMHITATKISTTENLFDSINFSVFKRAQPSIQNYAPQLGTAGSWEYYQGGRIAVSATVGYQIGQNNFVSYISSTAPTQESYFFHWTADAEL